MEFQTIMQTLDILMTNSISIEGSHRRCSVRKGAPRNLAKFTEKHLCQGLFFNKDAG